MMISSAGSDGAPEVKPLLVQRLGMMCARVCGMDTERETETPASGPSPPYVHDWAQLSSALLQVRFAILRR